jgi:hypothetical protein
MPQVAHQSARPDESRHVIFARALATVALAYLDRCEQEADQP